MDYGQHIIKIIGCVQADGLSKLKSFVTLTTEGLRELSGHHSVKIFHEVLTTFSELFSLVHYSLEDIRQLLFGGATIFAIVEGERPISCCVVHPIYGNVWEVGAVATLAAYQKRGLAQYVVSFATNDLLRNGLVPRYHVNVENIKSLRLAEACGYKAFLELNHYSSGLELMHNLI